MLEATLRATEAENEGQSRLYASISSKKDIKRAGEKRVSWTAYLDKLIVTYMRTPRFRKKIAKRPPLLTNT